MNESLELILAFGWALMCLIPLAFFIMWREYLPPQLGIFSRMNLSDPVPDFEETMVALAEGAEIDGALALDPADFLVHETAETYAMFMDTCRDGTLSTQGYEYETIDEARYYLLLNNEED